MPTHLRTCVLSALTVLCIALAVQPVGAVSPTPYDYMATTRLDTTLARLENNIAVTAYSLFGKDFLLVVNPIYGLHFYEVSGDEVVYRGTGQTRGTEVDVAVQEWYAFVIAGNNLSANSIAVPGSPIESDWLSLGSAALEIVLDGSHAYVATANGLVVVDISDPTNLQQVGFYAGPIIAVDVAGGLAVVRRDAGSSGTYELVDVADPTQPAYIGTLDVHTGFLHEILLHDDIAYFVGYREVYAIDVSVPTAPSATDTLTVPGDNYYAMDHLAWVGGELQISGVSLLAYLDPLSGAATLVSHPYDVIRDVATIADKTVGVTRGRIVVLDEGLHDQPTAVDLPLLSVCEPRGLMFGDVVYGKGNHGTGEVVAWEVGGGELWSQPLGFVTGDGLSLAQRGNLMAAVNHAGEFMVLDVSRQGVTPRGQTNLPGYFIPAYTAGGMAAFLSDATVVVYDSDNSTHLDFVDVSDRDHPQTIGQYGLSAIGTATMSVDGGLIVIAGWSWFQVVDATDPNNVVVHPAINHPTFYQAALANGHMHLMQPSPTSPDTEVRPHILETWSLLDPSNPVVVRETPLATPLSLVVRGDWGYQRGSGLLLDLSDPSRPVPVGNFTPDAALDPGNQRLIAGDQYLIIGEYDNDGPLRFVALPSADPTAPVSGVDDTPGAHLPEPALAAWPNPFNPRTVLRFELARTGNVQLAIHDLRGQLVRRLVTGRLEPGVHEATWDGLDTAGHGVASGTYFARLIVPGGQAAVRKLVLVR